MKILTPQTLAEALALKAATPAAAPWAGGTDLMVQWRTGARALEQVLALGEVAELHFVTVTDRHVEIGALVTHAEIAAHPLIAGRLPALAQGAASVGAPAVRNMGTLGGNLVNASPAADLAPALLAYEATVRLASSTARRELPLEQFFLGLRQVDLRSDELLLAVSVSLPPAGCFSRYYKLGARQAMSCAKLSLAGRLDLADGVVRTARFGAGSVAPAPIRLAAAEAVLTGQRLSKELAARAAEAAAKAVTPIDDVRSTAAYRRFALGSLVEQFVEEADLR